MSLMFLVMFIALPAIGCLWFSFREVVMGVVMSYIFLGTELQLLNNFVDGVSQSTMLVLAFSALVGGSFATFLIRSDNLHFSKNRASISVLLSGGILFLLLIILRGHRVAFMSYVSAEDNAKWAQLLSEFSKGHVSSLSINGAGGLGSAGLVISYFLLRAAKGLFGISLSRDGLVLSSVFLSHVLSVLIIATLLGTGKREASREFCRWRISVALIVSLLSAFSASFGFVTFNFGVAATILVLILKSRQGRSVGVSITIVLASFFVASFVWLPLVVILLPFFVATCVEMFRDRIPRGLSKVIWIAVVTVVGWTAIDHYFVPRLRYFQTIGSGGEQVWRELLVAGGAKVGFGLDLIVIVALAAGVSHLLVVRSQRGVLRHAAYVFTLSLPICGLKVVAGTLHADTSYSVDKITLFVLVIVLALAAIEAEDTEGSLPAHLEGQILAPSILVIFLIVLLGGTFSAGLTRMDEAFNPSRLSVDSRPWTTYVNERMAKGQSVPVACLMINDTGYLVPPLEPTYTCTRLLTHLAAGEEKFIGLQAFTLGRYTGLDMAKSLRYYLGNATHDTVLLLREKTFVVDKVVDVSEVIRLAEGGVPRP